jgi:uncharacterized membrane protein YciS (DUF1049 family)
MSIIPSHFSTAVFSTCDVKFWHFAVSTFLTLPKQIILVYLGVLLVAGEHQNDTTKNIIFAITGVITVLLAAWIYYKMRSVKKILLEEQAERKRQRELTLQLPKEKMTAAGARVGNETHPAWI